MSTLRQDHTTGQWVIIAPERGARPHLAHSQPVAASEPLPSFDPSCPFCPGNEDMLPGIIAETPDEAPPGWLARVVPNKFPAVSSDAPGELADATGRVEPGYGHHEVIIETSRHDARLTQLSAVELGAVIQTYRSRYRDLAARPRIASVLLFRNHGSGGGASLAHPHAQIIATEHVPPRIAEAEAWAESQFRRTGVCPTCERIEAEQEVRSRVVDVTADHLVVVPFAATKPFELLILPRRPESLFGDIRDAEIVDLAEVLRRALERLKVACNDPPYNFVIEFGCAKAEQEPYLHWRLRIIPDLTQPGGFELGGGLPINPSRPEDNARLLRGTQV